MGFSGKQVQALRRGLNSRYVRTRMANGRELSYIEGWFALAEANRIFGFDAWSRETVETAASSRGRTGDHFWPSISPRCALPCTLMVRPSCAKDTGREKGGGPHPAKCTTLLLRLLKRMQPREHWRRSANPLVLSFIARTRAHPRNTSKRSCLSRKIRRRSRPACHQTTRLLFVDHLTITAAEVSSR